MCVICSTAMGIGITLFGHRKHILFSSVLRFNWTKEMMFIPVSTCITRRNFYIGLATIVKQQGFGNEYSLFQFSITKESID